MLFASIGQYIFVGYNKGSTAVTATFVNETSKNSTLTNALGTNPAGQTACTNFSYCIPLPNPALSGNLLIVAGHFANSTTLTPTASDDKSDSFTCTTGGSKDTGTNEWPFLCYFANATSGAHMITIAFGTTAVTQVLAHAAQFYNVATTTPLDGSIGSCANASASTANCAGAAVTTTQANDLIYHAVFRAGTPAVTSYTAGAGFTLSTEDINDGSATQYQVDSGTGSLTPSMTMASASTYIAITAAFKSASAGTAPTGWYTEKMVGYSTPSAATTTYHFQFTTVGDLLVLTNNCGNSTGTTTPGTPSDGTNTWTSAGSLSSASDVFLNEFYVANAASNSTGLISITDTQSAGSGDCTHTFYSYVGAPTAPIVSQSKYNNSQISGSTVPMNTVAPDGISTIAFWAGFPSSGLSVMVGGQATGTSKGWTSPSTCQWDGASYGGMPLNGPEPIDQNNTYGSCFPSGSVSSATITQSNTASPGNNANDLVSFIGTNNIGIKNWTENVSTSTATLTVTVPSTTAGNLIVVAIGVFNATARTISKVCFDGTTCAAGNALAALTSSTSTGTGHGATAIWFIASAPSAKTTLTITFSASASNGEAMYEEVAGLSGTGTWASDGNGTHTTNGTGSGNTISAPAITTTGTDVCSAVVSITNGPVDAVPLSGNEYTYGGLQFAHTSDASASLITTSNTSHTPQWHDASSGDSFSSSQGCFKFTP